MNCQIDYCECDEAEAKEEGRMEERERILKIISDQIKAETVKITEIKNVVQEGNLLKLTVGAIACLGVVKEQIEGK